MSEIEQIEEIKIDCDSIIFNDGNKGLVKIKELDGRLQQLEDNLNGHTHTFIKAGTTPSATVTVGSATLPVSGSAPAITQKSNVFSSDYSGYENPKIKHYK